MAKTINTNLDSGIQKYTFTDSDGDVIASFRMNPADVRLAKKCEEVAQYFEELSKTAPDVSTADEMVKYNDQLEGKMCYLLGYDVKPDLFGVMSATTILPDGTLFVGKVIDTIAETVKPELEKRAKKMQASVTKYTAKYNK